MIVWIASWGERNEGSSVIGVYSTPDSAKRACEERSNKTAFRYEISDNDWIPKENGGFEAWVDSVDFCAVDPFEVDPPEIEN